MKSEFDKELEMLLRGHMGAARRDAASRGAAASAHLDADELSAYAENALPAETRARYVAHLADCDSCRKLATSIALAAGVAGELEKRAPATEKAAPASLWRERLAALFAPRVLRYASPVLALLVIGIIAFIATRTSRDGTLVADRTASQPQNITVPHDGEQAEQKTEIATSTATEGARESSSRAATEKSRSVPQQDMQPGAGARSGELAGTSTGPAAAPEPPPTATADASRPAPLPKSDEQALRARDENRPAAPQAEGAGIQFTRPKEKAETKDEDQIARRTQPEQLAAQKRAANEERELARTDEVVITANSSGRKAAASPTKPATSAPAARNVRRQRSETSKEEGARPERDDSSTEAPTRTIAGRRFRRQGGAWVDTAYNSSMATTNVRRNSEQYRALVADEPELGRIAEQLGGEVFVVWKGRAYRIR